MTKDPTKPLEEALLCENSALMPGGSSVTNWCLRGSAVRNANHAISDAPLVAGPELWLALGFNNAAAFRKARSRRVLEVRVFKLPGRRGVFALRRDLDAWLKSLGEEASM